LKALPARNEFSHILADDWRCKIHTSSASHRDGISGDAVKSLYETGAAETEGGELPVPPAVRISFS
jgi:hypothetical protein